MAKSKLLAISGLVLALVLALTCGLVFTVGSNPSTDANAAASHTDHTGWTDLNSYGSTTLASGKYYLSADFTGNLTLASYAKVVLCLNGYKLTGTGTGSVITLSGNQQLTLEDCNTTTEHQYYIDAAGLWKFDDGTPEWDTAYAEAGAEKQGVVNGGVITGSTDARGLDVNNGATFTMNGGTISGNEMGGVYLHGSSTATMNGGSLSGNKSRGIEIDGSIFTMNDGSISYNAGDYAGGVSAYFGTFNLTGGSIHNNTATESAGVDVDGTTFTMTGGTIRDNTATETGGAIVVEEGGKVNISNGTISGNTAKQGGAFYLYDDGAYLTISGGTISGNTATVEGSAIYSMSGNTGYITGGKISGTIVEDRYAIGNLRIKGGRFDVANTTTQKVGTDAAEGENGVSVFGGYEVVKDNADLEFPYLVQQLPLPETVSHDGTDGWYKLSTWIDTMGLILDEGKYFLDTDIVLTGALTIEEGVEVTLCLNGHKLAGNGSSNVIDVVSYDNAATLTVQDCNSTELSHDYYVNNKGLWVFNNGQGDWQASYEGAAVKSTVQGGVITGGTTGISMEYDNILQINGGTISGNTSSGIYSEGDITMDGGAISGNIYDGSGGYGGAGVRVEGTFTMNGGTISSNSNVYYSGNGGGVYASGLFVMNGGTITGNSATQYGGGIYAYYGEIVIAGGTISDNAATKLGGGVYVSSDSYIVMEDGILSGNTAPSGSAMYINTTLDSYISGGKISGTMYAKNPQYVHISGGRYELANVDAKTVGTDTADGANGIVVDMGTVAKDDAEAGYPYVVTKFDPPATVSHEGTDGWYELSQWIATIGTKLPAGKYFVDKDITLTSSLTIDGDVTLCLNGNKIAGNGKVNVISINGAYTLTLQDCNIETTHQYYVDGKGMWVFNNGQSGWQQAYEAAGAEKQGTVQGGVITAGYSNKENIGGGITVGSANLIINGGTIAGNNTYYSGSGVYLNGGTVTINGGAISGNYSDRTGAGIAFAGGTVTITGGTISHNAAKQEGAGIGNATWSGGSVVMTGGTISDNKTTSSESYYGDGGGIYLFGASFVMEGGTISNNYASADGGGVYVGSGDFTMNGGTISGNTASGSGGGVSKSGTGYNFIMNNGTISGNTADLGGGVYVWGGDFVMEDGTISGNTAKQGGAVYISYGRSFTMKGGAIEDNTGTTSGNGLYLRDTDSTFSISGGYLKDSIDNSMNGILSFAGGYFVEGDAGANTIQGFDVGSSTVVALEEGSEAYQRGYRFTVQYLIALSIETLGESQYDGLAIANKEDFTILVKIGSVENIVDDATYQYAVQGTEDFVDGLPSAIGNYTVKVIYVYDGETYEQQFNFAITKRTLSLSGLAAVDRPYDGTTTVQLSGNLVGAFDGDDVQLVLGTGTIESADVGNNKPVTYELALTGADMDKYALPQSTSALYVDITARKLQVNWSATEFQFNGAVQQPVATVETGVEGETLTLTTTASDSTYVGDGYTASATMETPNSNYVLVGSEITYSIVRKVLTVDWSFTEIEYNGALQQPTATADTGIDGYTVTLTVTADQSVNVGKYTASAVIEGESEYFVLTGDELSYSIVPKALTVDWGNATFTYNGKVQVPTVASVEQGFEGQTFTVNVTVDGGVNAGKHTATATIVNTDPNYTLANATHEYTIAKAKVEVQWGTTEFKVDGNVHAPSAMAIGLDGRALALTVEGGQSNVGSYTATATTTDGNYELTNASVNFTIVSNPNAVALGATIGGTAVAGGIAVAVIAILLKRKRI